LAAATGTSYPAFRQASKQHHLGTAAAQLQQHSQQEAAAMLLLHLLRHLLDPQEVCSS
jgi:hypothetical protein